MVTTVLKSPWPEGSPNVVAVGSSPRVALRRGFGRPGHGAGTGRHTQCFGGIWPSVAGGTTRNGGFPAGACLPKTADNVYYVSSEITLSQVETRVRGARTALLPWRTVDLSIETLWDGRNSKNLRVLVVVDAIKKGFRRVPSESFIVAPDGSFVGE